MSSREFRERLVRCLEKAAVPSPDAEKLDQLEGYFDLLVRWNRKINLTALPLEPPTDDTFERLFVEPLAAARFVPDTAVRWIDLGTGGGSPAVPLKILNPVIQLTMVESKVRKAAFLREAVRSLAIAGAAIENVRFEEISSRLAGTSQLVTVRAVRPDRTLFGVAASLLASDGRLFLFQADDRPRSAHGFSHLETVRLLDSRKSYLTVYGRVFHVEQRG